MTLGSTHPREDLLRYLDGAVSDEEKHTLEKHLSGCPGCQKYISLVSKLNEGLGGLSEEEFTTQEPCPDSWTLVSYEAGTVDEETARHVRAHLLFCDECQEEFLALRSVSRDDSWGELLERLKDAIVDLGRTYGPGALIGPARVLGEQAAFAVRGTEPQKAAIKALEVAVGENTYGLELSVNDDRWLSCNIAGVRTPVTEPLTVSVKVSPDTELISVHTDQHGNTQFEISGAEDAGKPLLLTLKLKDHETQMLVCFPRTSETG